jgi:hypothetical protein
MVLNLPLDECIDNTHMKVTREKEKKTNKKKLQQAIESQKEAKSEGPIRRTREGGVNGS